MRLRHSLGDHRHDGDLEISKPTTRSLDRSSLSDVCIRPWHRPASAGFNGLSEFDLWSQGYDASWIDRAVALVIMTFDMHEVHGFGDARHLIKTAQVVCTENLIRVADVMESPKLTE